MEVGSLCESGKHLCIIVDRVCALRRPRTCEGIPLACTRGPRRCGASRGSCRADPGECGPELPASGTAQEHAVEVHPHADQVQRHWRGVHPGAGKGYTTPPAGGRGSGVSGAGGARSGRWVRPIPLMRTVFVTDALPARATFAWAWTANLTLEIAPRKGAGTSRGTSSAKTSASPFGSRKAAAVIGVKRREDRPRAETRSRHPKATVTSRIVLPSGLDTRTRPEILPPAPTPPRLRRRRDPLLRDDAERSIQHEVQRPRTIHVRRDLVLHDNRDPSVAWERVLGQAKRRLILMCAREEGAGR